MCPCADARCGSAKCWTKHPRLVADQTRCMLPCAAWPSWAYITRVRSTPCLINTSQARRSMATGGTKKSTASCSGWMPGKIWNYGLMLSGRGGLCSNTLGRQRWRHTLARGVLSLSLS